MHIWFLVIKDRFAARRISCARFSIINKIFKKIFIHFLTALGLCPIFFFLELPNLILNSSATAEYKQYRAREGVFLEEKWDPF